MTALIRVVLADDHPLFRRGLREVLAEAGDLEVVAEAANGTEAVATIRETRPDVAILDLDMPGADGVTVARTIAADALPTRFVLLTAHRSDAVVQSALDAGVSGYVLKDGALTEIVDCIRAVHAGRPWVSAQVTAALLGRRTRVESFQAGTPGLSALTPAERGVLSRVALGATSQEIADALCISVRTVEHHRLAVARKLGLSGSNALVRFAIAHRSELS